MTPSVQKTGEAATRATSPALIGMSLRQDIPGGLLSSRARFRFSCHDHSETRQPRCQAKCSEKRSVPFGRVSKLDTVHPRVPPCSPAGALTGSRTAASRNFASHSNWGGNVGTARVCEVNPWSETRS